MKQEKRRDGYADLTLLLSLTLVGGLASLITVLPPPHMLWCAACGAATAYRFIRVART